MMSTFDKAKATIAIAATLISSATNTMPPQTQLEKVNRMQLEKSIEQARNTQRNQPTTTQKKIDSSILYPTRA